MQNTATPSSTFLLCTCQAGKEGMIVEQAQKKGLNPGYRRPGLVTFKASGPVSDEARLDAVYVRFSASCLGKAVDASGAVGLLRAVGLRGPAHLHVVRRDEDETLDPAAVEASLRDAGGALFGPSKDLRVGDTVVTVVISDAALWMCLHRHDEGRVPFPGGDPAVVVPDDAPSRAWAKLEEALLFTGVSLGQGDRVLEIGCSPGGVSHNLLQRGCKVIGVDGALMAPIVANHPNFLHVHASIRDVNVNALPKPIHAVVVDMNTGAHTMLDAIVPAMAAVGKDLRFVLLTFKMKRREQWIEVPAWQARARGFFPQLTNSRVVQLPANKSEVTFLAWR